MEGTAWAASRLLCTKTSASWETVRTCTGRMKKKSSTRNALIAVGRGCEGCQRGCGAEGARYAAADAEKACTASPTFFL